MAMSYRMIVRSALALNMRHLDLSAKCSRAVMLQKASPIPPSSNLNLFSKFHSSCGRMNKYIVNIQDAKDFNTQVLKSDTPVIVDFHATWCGPCKLLAPRLESVITAQDGKVVLAKVDIDELSELALEHGVQAVPTVIAIKGGKVQDKFVGMKDDKDLESFVKKLIGA